ncbi:MAG: acetyl-CoA acetyltransferase [Alcanivorax sp.]|jgi:acetyl-CoA acetyltransferase
MREVAVVGVGMTRFGKFLDKGIKDLVREAVDDVMADAGMEKSCLEAAYVGNAAAGAMTGQHMIRGQVVLDPLGINEIPIYNVENACASSTYAFNLAWTAVAAGVHDCVLVVGFEKLFDQDKSKPFLALESAMDVEDHIAHFRRVEESLGGGAKIFPEGEQKRSRLMDVYSFLVKRYMDNYGLTQEHFAKLSVKAHRNGALNPKAQYQHAVTLEEVLASGDVTYPFTRMMCAPIGDGASAAVLCSKAYAARFTTKPIWVTSSLVGSGKVGTDLDDTLTRRMGKKLFESGDIGPEDIDVAEVHDTTSSTEIIDLIDLNLCPGELAGQRIDEGYYDQTGVLPTNPSGGLISKGHPIGATGLGQIYEVVQQLRGDAGKRQVDNPKVALTHNGGGILGIDTGAMALHVFKK